MIDEDLEEADHDDVRSMSMDVDQPIQVLPSPPPSLPETPREVDIEDILGRHNGHKKRSNLYSLSRPTAPTTSRNENDVNDNPGEKKCLSDSILHSYRRTRSENVHRLLPTSSSTGCSRMSIRNTGSVLSSSGWGANASFSMIQRSAKIKEDIVASISKINHCLQMMESTNSVNGCTRMSDCNNSCDQYQHQQSFNPSHCSVRQSNQDLKNLCVIQVTQNISKLALYVEDDYYRIITGNMNGIEIIIQAMNAFSSYEEKLAATCNLTLGILCQRSPLYQSKLLNASGIQSIIKSIENFPTSDSVCSTAVDALIHITTNNAQAMAQLRQIQNISFMLHSISNCLYPLSTQNKDILLSQL